MSLAAREDVLLSRLMEAQGRGELDSVAAHAVTLGRVCPELRAWTAYVVAGCLAVAGEPAEALRVLSDAEARGGWWSPRLLGDPALAPVWALDPDGIRNRSARRWREAQAAARAEWDLVPASAGRTSAVVVALHPNCSTSETLIRSLWAELPACAVAVARSSQLLASGVRDWHDRDQAVRDVRAVAAAARARFPSAPLILAGMGAGGRIALDAALTAGVHAAGVLAFAPALDGLLCRLPAEPHGPPGGLEDEPPGGRLPGGPRCWLFPGGPERARQSCARFAGWAEAHGVSCTVRTEPGMGHHYPLRFGESVAPAVETIVAGDERTAGR